jgi:hypothetical protein
MKKYIPFGTSTHIGTTGFVNHFGIPSETMEHMVNRVFEENPNSVIINGTDNWHAPEFAKPEVMFSKMNKKPIAFFHTGTSGISTTGIVITIEDYNDLSKSYQEKYGFAMDKKLKIYFDKSNQIG